MDERLDYRYRIEDVAIAIHNLNWGDMGYLAELIWNRLEDHYTTQDVAAALADFAADNLPEADE
jgi:hypothetical protein